MSKVKLFSYWRSSCSYRVRIALNLKAIPHEYVTINLVKDGGEQKKDHFLKINPFGFIPSLEVNGDNNQNQIFESLAIIDYLENINPEPSLYPKDLIDRANAIAITESINSGIQPLQNLFVLAEIENLGGNKDQWAKQLITKKFKSLENIMTKTAGKYCIGDTITIADVFLVPQVYNAYRYGVDMSQYPTIERVNKLLEEHEAFKAAHPSVQPDAPKQ
ncbi:LOW QUALITY PROTEIN: maleylacetoacetate isomerase-like [Panonychus citri]|uniref:LOW QUALITY PROTEIN: maleylacetoacetate isomerase-like n=1 Tax=Panonychus citri TaxID=50023 RepID=UPI002307B0C6|nr:LOW QUALITY PROTEIN: maleylacetoacetate isomerase-like [Panonychus citri]